MDDKQKLETILRRILDGANETGVTCESEEFWRGIGEAIEHFGITGTEGVVKNDAVL